MDNAGLTVEVHGTCAPAYQAVRDAFEANFSERDEVGASVCVLVGGEPVVDLWGGFADEASGRRWERNTMNVIMSASKGVAALCGVMVMDRGLLDPDRPIADYWPAFAKHGKDGIPVRMAFNHQSGVCHVSAEAAPTDWYDHDAVVALIEDTPPFWQPGTRHGYGSITAGTMMGELVRRTDGRTIGTFLREEVAEPLGLDLWMGLPETENSRVAPSIPVDLAAVEEIPPGLLARIADPSLHLGTLMGAVAGVVEIMDSPLAHAAEAPWGGVITNARSLAGMYAPLSLNGSISGVRLVGSSGLAQMRRMQSVGRDAVMGVANSFSMGFANCFASDDPNDGSSVVIGEGAFGHPGFGGQIGFADPDNQLAFAYTMTKHGIGTGLNERGQTLIDATYETLGSPGREFGYWRRPEI